MPSPGGSTKLSFTPELYERPYYQALFAVADTERSGSIAGAQAVPFFSRSKLPVEALKSVWTLSDQPPSNGLDLPKFAVAIRLIQLLQNGQKGTGPNLGVPPGTRLRPAMFEGISGASVALPVEPGTQGTGSPQQQPSSPQQAASPPRPYTNAAPPRPPTASGPPPPGMTALATQDPYMLSPSDQYRYESIFPQYAKEDGYVYGQEAVALFSKSGLAQPLLAAIWNMVDSPVDNRLDKLEFAMGMHLIVCISKKNLPAPPTLPVSLQQLKSQQSAQQGATSPGTLASAPPLAAHQQPPPMQLASNMSAMTAPSPVPPPIQSSMSMTGSPAPPLQPTGGMSISDAFEGLSARDGPAVGATTMNADASIGSYAAPPPVPTSVTFESSPSPPDNVGVAHTMAPSVPTPPPMSVPSPAPKSSQELTSSYDMGGAHEELNKLKSVLHKLQAENVSLKAQLGTMSEDEKDVQRELGATVAEIGKLSSQLTTVRAQVLASKSRLLEATAELTAAKEKKAVVSDLIGEATATRNAINDAHEGVEAAVEAAATTPSNGFDGDLFGFDSPAPAPAPMMIPLPVSAPATQQSYSYDSVEAPDDYPSQQPMGTDSYDYSAPTPALGMYGAPTHQRTASAVSVGFDSEAIMGGAYEPNKEVHAPESYGSYDNSSTPTVENIAELQRKAKEAGDLARDAEESRRQVMAQVNELRRVADEAEEKARTQQTGADGKRKGFMGRGKKKEAKENEKVLQDAKTKKDQFLAAQSQANDTEAIALQTKQEADKLMHEAEEAEMRAAAAASMSQAPTSNGSVPSYNAQQPVSTGGGFDGQPYGGYNAPAPYDGGIPTPTGGDDPYDNPF